VTFLALAVPVGAASLAYACTALATLSVTSGPAAPGSTVTATGKGFNGGLHGADPATATRTPVVMHWNTRSGPVVASVTPANLAGDLPTFTFTAPNVAPGQYVLIGVQNDPATNAPYYGTPARQSVTIATSGARTAARSGGAATAGESSAAPAAPVAAPAAPSASASTASPAAATGSVGSPAPARPSGPAARAATPATPAAAADLSSPSSPAAVAAAASAPAAQLAASPDAVTTATPGLLTSSAPERTSAFPALLLLLGVGLGLIALARWITSRLPLLRRSATASA
jgi:hypothetical protein